jgi:hypothetical protein
MNSSRRITRTLFSRSDISAQSASSPNNAQNFSQRLSVTTPMKTGSSLVSKTSYMAHTESRAGIGAAGIPVIAQLRHMLRDKIDSGFKQCALHLLPASCPVAFLKRGLDSDNPEHPASNIYDAGTRT